MEFRNAWQELVLADGPLPFVLIDAAGLPRGAEGLPHAIFSEIECLFVGDLADELIDVAPYLGRLARLDDAAERAMAALFKADAAILALSTDASLLFSQLHRHLRKFNVVYAPDGAPLFFRYYDPRIVQDVLHTLEPDQRKAFFGPIESLLLPDAAGGVVRCHARNGELSTRA